MEATGEELPKYGGHTKEVETQEDSRGRNSSISSRPKYGGHTKEVETQEDSRGRNSSISSRKTRYKSSSRD